mmetsp:Transcript_7629/g.23127  ORF Transcript_7629/g.23127 Transcript_7629/m.23127 type:complete len:293 (+) Transcript_7629:138-1016(+)
MGFEGTRAVFMGTGVSTAIPNLRCVMRNGDGHGEVPCEVCADAVENPYGPNNRGNVALLVQNRGKNYLVDCGKTMRQAALKWFAKFGVDGIDAVILTHGHADAIGGIDDLRDVQRVANMPVYLNAETQEVCATMFPYLVCQVDIVPRRVAKLQWNQIENNDEIVLDGLSVKSLPLYHGGTYISLGLIFGDEDPFVYLSDLHKVPEDSMRRLKQIRSISTLVVDALNWAGHNSHYSLAEAIDLVKELQPKQAFFVGMTCSLGLHDEVCSYLDKIGSECGIPMQLARDGQVLHV